MLKNIFMTHRGIRGINILKTSTAIIPLLKVYCKKVYEIDVGCCFMSMINSCGYVGMVS